MQVLSGEAGGNPARARRRKALICYVPDPNAAIRGHAIGSF